MTMFQNIAIAEPSKGRSALVSLGKLARKEPLTFCAIIVLVAVAIIAIFAPWLGTVDPARMGVAPRAGLPSAEYWFGGDQLGRDLYSRVLYGTRVSVMVGLGVAVIALSLGLVVGLLAGTLRWLDSAFMRVMDGIMSIPPILFAIALVAIAGGSLEIVIVAIAIVEIPRVARLVRSSVLTLREQPFVDAAITVGTPMTVIVFRHILPNAIAPLIVQVAYIFAQAIMIEAGLSFIGAGVPPDIPSWGNIMSEGRILWQVKPHLVMIPAIGLSLTVLAVNIVGDSLRDHLDPRQQKGV